MKLFKQKNSPFWYGRVKIDGKDHWISGGTSRKKDAERAIQRKIAVLKENVSAESLFDDLVKVIDALPDADRERKKQQFASRLMQGKTAKLALTDTWESYKHSPMIRNPSERTISDYRSIWNRFESWANERGIDYLHQVDETTAQDYCQSLRKNGFAPSTYNSHVQFLRSTFKALRVQAGLVSNPWEDIPTLKKQTESHRNLTPVELNAVCSKATGDLRYIFALGIFTGARLGDVVSMQWSAINFGTGFIEIVPRKTKRTGKKVRLPILPPLEMLLRELRDSSTSKKYLFPEVYKTYQTSPSVISKRIQQHFKSCGIKTTEKPKKGQRFMSIVRVGFHSLRHSFVSMLVKHKVPQTAIAALVGHGSPVMTENYTHLDDDQRRKAMAGISNLIDFNKGDGA